MTFEQWAEEMNKGLIPQKDENRRVPSRPDSISSWNDDRFEGESEGEDSTNSPS